MSFRGHEDSREGVRSLVSVFSPPGLRGAIPYALSLHLGLEPVEKRQLIGTTTIIIVLFTILLMGGGTMPLIRVMDIEESQARRGKSKNKGVTLSKTEKMVMIEDYYMRGCALLLTLSGLPFLSPISP